MKYFRTKDGKIIPFLDEDRETKLPTRDLRFYYIQPDNAIAFIDKDEIVKQANTIEELICNDDILYIYDLYPDAVLVVEGNIRPFGYPTLIELKEWLDYTHYKFDLLIKDSKGNYIKRATTNDKGELALL